MTGFALVYDGSHEYNEGIIEIPNTTSNLKMAYLAISSSVSNVLSAPILRGFLYQVQVDEKRSRPYPIVSDRQTIRLDMSECEKFLFVPSNRIINEYSIALHVSTESGGGESIDLSDYALKSELPNFDNYVTESVLATILADYALTSQLPNLSDYVTGANLDTILKDYVLTSELPSLESGSQNYTLITAISDPLLEVNKKYLVTEFDLASELLLPENPSIGDVIVIVATDFKVTVFQNGSQTILNKATETPPNSDEETNDTGIILGLHACVELVYVGSDLWVTGFRERAVNNWLPQSIEPTASQKTYTPSFFNSVSPAYGTVIGNIKNGVSSPSGNYITDGLLVDQSLVQILVTFDSPIRLTSFDFYGGQGNVSLGSANNGYKVETIEVYSGNTTENLIDTFSPSNLNGSQQTFTVDTSETAYEQYLFSFSRSGNGIGIMELILNGKGQIGGATLAV